MKAERRRATRRKKAADKRDEEIVFDEAITDAEDERTTTAKAENKIKPPARQKVTLLQREKSMGWALSTSLRRTSNNILARKGVRFAKTVQVATFQNDDNPVMVTYNSGADGNYLSEKDRLKAGMPILRRSTQRVGVANNGTSNGKWETALPLPQLSKEAVKADSFDEFPTC